MSIPTFRPPTKVKHQVTAGTSPRPNEDLSPGGARAKYWVADPYRNVSPITGRVWIGAMDFDGFGIGGSFDKKDMAHAVRWVNALLPEEKPRHLLGIGDPVDLLLGIESGADLFDCVAPTRLARSGTILTHYGHMNIEKVEYKNDFQPIEKECTCEACANYSRAYLRHLFKEKELLAYRLASIHNLYFTVSLVSGARAAILDGTFSRYKKNFLDGYKKV